MANKHVVEKVDKYVQRTFPELTAVHRAELYLSLAMFEYDRTSFAVSRTALDVVLALFQRKRS